MIYGTKYCNNGTITGKLEFFTGKKVHLNSAELLEFQQRIRDWQYQVLAVAYKEHTNEKT